MDALKAKQDERTTLVQRIKELYKLTEPGADGVAKALPQESRAEFETCKESIGRIDQEITQLRTDAADAAFVARLEADADDTQRDETDNQAKRRNSGEWSKRQQNDAFQGLVFPAKYTSHEQRELGAKMQARVGEKGGYLLQGLHGEQPKRSELLDRKVWTEMRKDEREERRALSVGTTTAGGHLVPDEMMREIESAMLDFNGVRQACEVIRTNTGADLPIPTCTDTANTGALVDEHVEMDELDVAFGQVVLQSFAYTSKIVRASWQLMRDSSVNLPAFLGRQLGTRIGRIEGAHDTTGTGSSQPNGVVTGAGNSGVTTASNTAVTVAEMANIAMTVDNSYWAGASTGFMFDQTILGYLMGVDSNAFKWAAALGGQNQVFGWNYWLNNNMATGASAKAILFGDFSAYKIRDVVDIEFIQLNERFATLGQVGFLAWHRHDADITDATAIKYATLSA